MSEHDISWILRLETDKIQDKDKITTILEKCIRDNDYKTAFDTLLLFVSTIENGKHKIKLA
jgi:hypothetical protein